MKDETSKKSAALKALDFVRDGMILGLGTGSTVKYFLEGLSEKITKEKIKVRGIPTSTATEKLAKQLKIPLTSLDEHPQPNLCVDGADEVDSKFNLIKGRGGAMTREKIVASASLEFIVIVDESKIVKRLGGVPVPVEVIPFSKTFVTNELKEIGATSKERAGFITDNGNIILDVLGLDLSDPLDTEGLLNNIPGVLENGVFSVRIPEMVVVGSGKEAGVLGE